MKSAITRQPVCKWAHCWRISIRISLLSQILFLVFFISPVLALNLTLGRDHFNQAMEFYYQAPRPEIILPMLRSFAQSRALANGGKRMMLAAFLSELIKKGAIKPETLIEESEKLGRDARLVAAWSLHLTGQPEEPKWLGRLLTKQDAQFASQIRKMPARLENWNPAWESSVLGMYWGAFMATGSPVWIERIITEALAGNRDNNMAAASLYDSASRHPLVAEILAKRLKRAKGQQKEILELILANAGRR